MKFEKKIEFYGWKDIPKSITSREGKKIPTVGNEWHLPIASLQYTKINFSKINNDEIIWALKSYVIDCIQRISTVSGLTRFNNICAVLKRINFDTLDVEASLIKVMEESIYKARQENKLWTLYRVIKWYIYCADKYPDLCFNEVYSYELECMKIPGGPKGESVRMEDPRLGALDRNLELPLLVSALKKDTSKKFKHLQEKAALVLSLAFGRNPSNLVFLRESDFYDLTPNLSSRCYVINIPRIKKRLKNPRDDFRQEYIEPEFAKHIIDLIKENQLLNIVLTKNFKVIPNPKPLFVNLSGNKVALVTNDYENAYSMHRAQITELLKSFVRRHNIISPITNKLLRITSRRMRYTLAVNLVLEGVSRKELARILDHTDTQHVSVYFEVAARIVEHLDRSSALEFSKYMNYFTGTIVDKKDEKINLANEDKTLSFWNENDNKLIPEIGVCGQNSICHLDPPYSCYLCPKFQPYREADHGLVLDSLLISRKNRIKKYEKSRLGVQLDDVISAVAEVVNKCEGEN